MGKIKFIPISILLLHSIFNKTLAEKNKFINNQDWKQLGSTNNVDNLIWKDYKNEKIYNFDELQTDYKYDQEKKKIESQYLIHTEIDNYLPSNEYAFPPTSTFGPIKVSIKRDLK